MGEFRVILSGNSPAVGEVWSVGCSLSGLPASMPQEDLNQWALGIANALEALATPSLFNILSSSGSITTVRVEQRSATDESLLGAGEAQLIPPKVGAGSANKVLQAAVVISHRTLIPGRSYRGRAYWPAWAYTPTAEMRFNAGDVTSWLNAYIDLIELFVTQAIVVDPSYAMILVVRSRLLHVSTPVTSLAIGNVPDVQRRRRDALAETYTVINV